MSKRQTILLVVVFSILFWLLESFIHVLLTDGSSFVRQLFPQNLHEIRMRGIVVCILIAFGTVVQYISTGRERVEKKLRFLCLITEQVTDSIITTNLNHKITYVNNAFRNLYGYSAADILGKPPDILNAEPNSKEIQDDIYRTVSSGKVWSVEHLNRRKDGSTFLCELKIFALVDEQGKVIGYGSSQRDITERKLAEEALEEAREKEISRQAQLIHADRLRTVGRLAAGVAHEINNPLSVLYGTLQSVRAGKALDFSDDPETVERSLRVTQRIRDTVNNLLAFSREGSSEKASHDINDVLEDVLSLISSQLQKDSIAVELLLDESLCWVLINRERVQQVFLNIILNAQDAMPGGGKLTISTKSDGDYVAIRFTDTGRGIAKEDIDSIFTPFYTTKEVGKGAGLGLSISHGIIQEHNGRIEVYSRVGEGIIAEVLLPVWIKPGKQERGNDNDDSDH